MRQIPHLQDGNTSNYFTQLWLSEPCIALLRTGLADSKWERNGGFLFHGEKSTFPCFCHLTYPHIRNDATHTPFSPLCLNKLNDWYAFSSKCIPPTCGLVAMLSPLPQVIPLAVLSPLTCIIKHSLASGSSPRIYKHVVVSSIFKDLFKKYFMHPPSYCPIALLSFKQISNIS